MKLKKLHLIVEIVMAYWLLKTEPDNYSYFDLERDRSKVWHGVNNPLALKHLRTMLIGDLALICSLVKNSSFQLG